MNLFTWMLVGHLAGDFLLQTSWMAERKVEEWAALLAHCFVYTSAIVFFALPAGGLSPSGIAAVFVGHAIIDRRKFVNLWAKYISRSPGNAWLKIVQDQVWHIIVMALATLL